MHRVIRLTAFAAASVLILVGCESHQTKIDALQKEYDRLGQQFRRDCNAEYLKVPPSLSPKCADENKHVEEAWNRLQAERTKK